ncbi:MAG: LysM domain-containing protein, partial [Rhodospirillaceae bacterium]
MKKNQNIYEIAQELNVNPNRLVRKNELFPPYKLKKGQVLKIPSRNFGSEGNNRRDAFQKRHGRVTRNRNSWRKPPVERLPSPSA